VGSLSPRFVVGEIAAKRNREFDGARTFADRDARATLSHMAQAWLRLADNCQDPKKVRPAMQQQQQFQARS
jgi:hypothetical protein